MTDRETQQIEISEPRGADELSAVKNLFEAYMVSLGIDLQFQDADRELQEFPHSYVALLHAKLEGNSVGAVALKRLEAGVCEMKRLYCVPQMRGLGVGRLLAERIIESARMLNYDRMRLDTFATMRPAVTLYASLDFRPIPAYYHNPYPDVVYFELDLTR